MTMQSLADEYGAIAMQIKVLQARQDVIRRKLAGYKSNTFVGNQYTVKRCMYERASLDTVSIRTEMGEAWMADRMRTVEAVRFTVTASAASTIKIAA